MNSALEQCLGAPFAGVGQGAATILLPYLIVIAMTTIGLGLYLFRSYRSSRRVAIQRPRRRGIRGLLLSLLVTATLATGTLFLPAEAFAQQIPAECQRHDSTPAIPSVSVPLTMQTITATYCRDYMDIYRANGTDEDHVLSLTDSRGGVVRTYHVAKLADGNCWMLDNLRLGSTDTAITLTPTDSDVVSNFTLPQLSNGSRMTDNSHNFGNDFDTPYAYGPVPGDMGGGAANYGYLYNWSAATAGATRMSNPAGSGTAASSICPGGWRLPTGGTSSSDFGTLDIAFGGTGTPTAGPSHIAQWQFSGPFRGTYSGIWNDGFYTQSIGGILWSASAYPDEVIEDLDDNFSFFMFFQSPIIYPGDYPDYRAFAMGVRCVLR